MQAEATDSLLREGIEALGVKDTEKSAEVKEDEGNRETQDTEMTAATEEDSSPKEEKGFYIKMHTLFEKMIIIIIHWIYEASFKAKSNPKVQL